MVYTIRESTREDIETIAIIHQKSWQHAYRGIVSDAYLDALDYERWVNVFYEHFDENGIRRPGAPEGYVVESDGQIAGAAFVGATRDEDFSSETGEIMSIYFLPQYCGKGLGGALLHHALKRLKEMGFRQCIVWVLSENRAARAVYEHIGFVPDSLVTTLDIGGQQVGDMRYSRTLEDI